MQHADPRLSDRAALARAITLAESTRGDHQREAQALLTEILPLTGKSIRLGITGVPGVGKSTFIEALGMHAIDQGHRVAVLAVDPSSTRTGGSILGDKTRMGRLAQHDRAFIRPTPTAGALGGVARRTREAMLLCEAAGYDVIITETVGVGQSETEVADMVDMFMLLLLPGSGDEMQGIKKGIVELADLLIVNKADGDMLAQAKRVRADYAAALKLLHPSPPPTGGRPGGGHPRDNAGVSQAGPHPLDAGERQAPPAVEGVIWQPKVMTCSALTGENIAAIWDAVGEFRKNMAASGEIDKRRAEQARAWMWKEVREALIGGFLARPEVEKKSQALEQKVMRGTLTPAAAAAELLKLA